MRFKDHDSETLAEICRLAVERSAIDVESELLKPKESVKELIAPRPAIAIDRGRDPEHVT